MIVLKFGGTSIGNAERIKKVAQLINTSERKIVVLSAMSGTTNALVEIAKLLHKNNKDAALNHIKQLEEDYIHVIEELYTHAEYSQKGLEMVRSHFDYIKAFAKDMFTHYEEKAILAQGELISTTLMHYYLKEQKIDSALFPALNFMKIKKNGEPDSDFIEEHLMHELSAKKDAKVIITQGFICRNAFGEVDNLKRGGSDYTAALIGAAIKAEEIQIWTDIDGMHNNDPRFVKNTRPLSDISFEEAAELAYFGAKILHPASVQPCKVANIPVRVKNTMKPQSEGTLISDKSDCIGIRAVAAKDGITAIKIKSGRMLLAHGFLRKVFEIFEAYETSIDMITTSEVAVSLTIDNISSLNEIASDLSEYGQVEIDHDHSIICVVGDFIAENKGYALKVFDALKDISIRMISYGGSRHNVSVLVQSFDKEKALNALNSLFGDA